MRESIILHYGLKNCPVRRQSRRLVIKAQYCKMASHSTAINTRANCMVLRMACPQINRRTFYADVL